MPHRYRMRSNEDQRKLAAALLPILAWICVALALRYGYYGNNHLILGPNSSRMLKTSSVFVDQVQVSDEAGKGLLLYGFSKRPELSLETNWTISNQFYIDSYTSQGFSMWLNRGSRIWMTWKLVYGGGSSENILVVLIKGEQNLKEVQRFHTMSTINVTESNVTESGDGLKKAEYNIEEDDRYYINVVNLNYQSMVTTLKVDASSMIYDTSEATSICSTSNGICRLNLRFPNTKYFVLTTSENDVITNAWHVELSFAARLIAYFAIIGVVVVVIYMIMHHLGACDPERPEEEATTETETNPILPKKEIPSTYGTIDEDPISSLCSSSEDLYDGKICAICYDERRNCYFIPCGHSATCYTCAQRIMEEENKLCPICRRLIHKAKRLLIP